MSYYCKWCGKIRRSNIPNNCEIETMLQDIKTYIFSGDMAIDSIWIKDRIIFECYHGDILLGIYNNGRMVSYFQPSIFTEYENYYVSDWTKERITKNFEKLIILPREVLYEHDIVNQIK